MPLSITYLYRLVLYLRLVHSYDWYSQGIAHHPQVHVKKICCKYSIILKGFLAT